MLRNNSSGTQSNARRAGGVFLQGARRIGRARTTRINAGQVVIGQRWRNRRIRKGRWTPIGYTNQQRNGLSKLSTQGVSLKNTTQSEYSSKVGQTVNKTELAFDVHVTPEGTIGNVSNYPLMASNTEIFKTLVSYAKQYQYFTIEKINVIYTTACDAQQPGVIYMGVVDSFDTLMSVQYYSAMVGSTRYQQCNVYQTTQFAINKSDLNTQFTQQGCAFQDWTTAAEDNPMSCPGYLIFALDPATNPSDAYTDVKVGTITISYVVKLSKPRVDSEPPEAEYYEVTHPASTTEIFNTIEAQQAARTLVTHPLVTCTDEGGGGFIDFKQSGTYHVKTFCAAKTATQPHVALTVEYGCQVTELYYRDTDPGGLVAADQFASSQLFKVVVFGPGRVMCSAVGNMALFDLTVTRVNARFDSLLASHIVAL